jgi:hypothetical protein
VAPLVADLAAARARLADLDAEIARLRYRHDIAISAFRFEEATALGPAIAALETERHALAEAVPPTPAPTAASPPRLRVRRGIPGRRSR